MPLGWHISIYRQRNDGMAAASFGAEQGTRLVVWQTGLHGLDWLNELARQQKIIALGGNGYPVEYTAMACMILPFVAEDPPAGKAVWSSGRGDLILPGWQGETTSNVAELAACRPDEWLIIQAWDES